MVATKNIILGTNEHRIPGEAREILKSIASKWEDVSDTDSFQVIPLKGALTNEVFQIKWPTKTKNVSRKLLLRIYGEGVHMFFERQNEIRVFELLSNLRQGPRLLGRFSNGRIEEFLCARTLSAPDLRDPEIATLIATKMKEFHTLEMPGPKVVLLWDRLRTWLKIAKSLASSEEAKAFRLDAIRDEMFLLEKELSEDSLIGYCHNDLQYGNMMIDEGTKIVTLIDYEYASYNPIAFDIANLFCEMVANYHTDTPHILNYSNYPGLEERRRFIQAYITSSGYPSTDDQVQLLLKNVQKYTLASHLMWGLWGIISDHVNDIDFDYMEYARQRFEQYWLRKSELLESLKASHVGLTHGDRVITKKSGSKKTKILKMLKKYLSLKEKNSNH